MRPTHLREGQIGRDKHGELCKGVRLWMRDGTIWFHPYSGREPVREDLEKGALGQ